MTNKVIGYWIVWTLGVALFTYLAGAEDFAGIVILVSWVFTFIGGFRLIKA